MGRFHCLLGPSIARPRELHEIKVSNLSLSISYFWVVFENVVNLSHNRCFSHQTLKVRLLISPSSLKFDPHATIFIAILRYIDRLVQHHCFFKMLYPLGCRIYWLFFFCGNWTVTRWRDNFNWSDCCQTRIWFQSTLPSCHF